MSSLITMQAAVWSVNCWLNVKPSRAKNAFDFSRSLTGRLTKILVATVCPLVDADDRSGAATRSRPGDGPARRHADPRVRAHGPPFETARSAGLLRVR